MNASEVKKDLKRKAKAKKAAFLQKYFKTGPGEYGEGDRFIGVIVPELRKTAKLFRMLSMDQVVELLRSPIHEERVVALMIWSLQYSKAEIAQKNRIYSAYFKNIRHINNWDLVDGSAPLIVGPHWYHGKRDKIDALVRSKTLWHRRIAVLGSFYFIRQREFALTLKLARTLLGDPEDLMHKAVGWMLREVGNREVKVLKRFLELHSKRMPRTMLRYSIERLSPAERKRYMKR